MEPMDMERRQAVSEIFLILAELYKYPHESFYLELASKKVDEELKKLFAAANYKVIPLPDFSSRAGEFSQLKKSYSSCFLGLVQPYAMPVESVYKVWTTDPTAQLNFANSKGYVMGDSALHINHLIEHFHLEIPEEYRTMPDHLTILLELYSYIQAERNAGEAYQFIKDHFNWLDEFKKVLCQLSNNHFYLYVLEILQGVIAEEKLYYQNFN